MRHDSLQNLLAEQFAAAIAQVTGRPADQIDPAVRPAGDPQFGDYQCNAAMALARPLKAKPREVAQRIADAVTPLLADIAEPLEIAGPGFINIRLKGEFLSQHLSEIPAPRAAGIEGSRDQGIEVDRVGLPPVERPLRVVVEYSQPNIAKQMHVGHLRSTIIGDVFARVLAFEGHEVIRQNHIGDWGTQFGMLIRWYREHPLPTPQVHADVLEAIENDYRAAQQRFDHDEQFAAEARLAVGALQSGDPQARQVWERLCAESWRAFTELYEHLDVLLTPENVRGESFYNDRLPLIVEELRQKLGTAGAPATAHEQSHRADAASAPRGRRALLRADQGALVIYLYDDQGEPLFKNPEGQALGMIVQKSDGAYLYATTDLAAIRFRLKELEFPSGGIGAQRVIYVTDARQKLHFQMFFACARAAGWITDDVRVEHVTFGSVLGPDRKPLKTRAGQTVKLRELLDEAEKRAYALLENRDQGSKGSRDQGIEGSRDRGIEGPRDQGEEAPAVQFSEDEKREIARRVGIAAVKYADLRNDRTADYVFDWDKMLALQGNTAPYMMYAHARIRSIYRKAAERFGAPDVYAPHVRLVITHPAERALALRLARLREAISDVATNLTPHTLCTYLYELAADFMRFYESCPVLAAPDETARLSRMRLCDLTARTLKLGLGLLGIEAIERM
jgi:arginyl-tRNA synthetase